MKKIVMGLFLLQAAFVWQDGGGWLGVEVDKDVTTGEIKIFKVTRNSPASRVGLKEGDVIKSVDGEEFKEVDDLIGYIMKKKPNENIKLTIDRDGDEKIFNLKLGKRARGGPGGKPGRAKYKSMIEKSDASLWKDFVTNMEKDEKAKFEKMLNDCSAATARVMMGGGGGSGFLIKGGKYLVTAGHVAKKKGTKLSCVLPDGRVFDGKVVYTMMKPVDAAILEVINPKGEKYPSVEIEEPQKGEQSLMLGYPGMHGMDKLGEGASVVGGMGKANAKKEGFFPTRALFKNKIVTDTQITIEALNGIPPLPGNSGGPLFNMDGKAIGIVVRTTFKSIGYVTPSGWIKKYFDEKEGKRDEDGCLVHRRLAKAL